MAHSPPRYARPWLYLALVVAGWLALALASAQGPRPDDAAGRFTPFGDVTHVSFGDARYLANTEVLRLPDTGMVAIGTTREGYVVYTQRGDTATGGGGGGPPPTAPPGSRTPGPAYLKTPDG
ncbi:MAG: hypothetical protein ACK46X_18770, partial [Candidatus Sericytochromatia bacterium]